MAYEIPGFSFTVPASTGVTGTQFRFVSIDGNGEAVFTAGAGAIGVMTNKPDGDGIAATIVRDGIVKVQAAGSTVSQGDLVTSDSSGRASAGTSTNALGRVVAGSSGSTDRVLSVLLGPISG